MKCNSKRYKRNEINVDVMIIVTKAIVRCNRCGYKGQNSAGDFIKKGID